MPSDIRIDCVEPSKGLESVMLKSSPSVVCPPNVMTTVRVSVTAGSSKITRRTDPSTWNVELSSYAMLVIPAAAASMMGLIVEVTSLRAFSQTNPRGLSFETFSSQSPSATVRPARMTSLLPNVFPGTVAENRNADRTVAPAGLSTSTVPPAPLLVPTPSMEVEICPVSLMTGLRGRTTARAAAWLSADGTAADVPGVVCCADTDGTKAPAESASRKATASRVGRRESKGDIGPGM